MSADSVCRRILYNITQYCQYYTILPILDSAANPACQLQVSLAIHGFDIAVGMSPEVCSKCVHVFTVAAQYTLSQDEIDTILHDKELDSHLFTVGEAQKALTTFSLSKNARSVFSDVFSRKGAVPRNKIRVMCGLAEGKTIFTGNTVWYCVVLCSIICWLVILRNIK